MEPDEEDTCKQISLGGRPPSIWDEACKKRQEGAFHKRDPYNKGGANASSYKDIPPKTNDDGREGRFANLTTGGNPGACPHALQ